MNRTSAALSMVCAFAALTLAASASAAGPTFGVADDAGKYANDSGSSFFSSLNDIGMTENRMAVVWDEQHPTAILDQAFLDRSIPQAVAHRIKIIFSVYALHPRALGAGPAAAEQFAQFAALLARTYPQVTEFICGNEPNQPRFFQPQFDANAQPVAGALFEVVTADCYDALKAVNPSIVVDGVGLSPRGNDDPGAASNISTSPVRFIHDFSAAYRASGRKTPLMDAFAFHCYPRQDTDPLVIGYPWPNAGCVNLDRVKQALWDGFSGTAQPTVETGLKLKLDEVGWQVAILADHAAAYHGVESVKPTTEATQASIYGSLIQFVYCDASIDTLNFFHLVDESDLDRFQTGLVRADYSQRPSYAAVKLAIAQQGCSGRLVSWQHETGVIGAAVDFGGRWTATASEDASFKAGVLRLAGRGVDRKSVARVLASTAQLSSSVTGSTKAYWPTQIRLGAGKLQPGWYVRAVRMTAAMNPARTSLFVGKSFHISG